MVKYIGTIWIAVNLIWMLSTDKINAQPAFSVDTTSIQFSSSAEETVFYYYIELFNDSGVDLNLRWKIIEETMPEEWQIRIVDPQSYHPFDTDSADFILSAQASALDKMLVHFFPNQTPGTGRVKLSVHDIAVPSDSIVLTYNATATPFEQDTTPTAIGPHISSEQSPFLMYPNPANDQLILVTPAALNSAVNLRIFDAHGKVCLQDVFHKELNTINLNIYDISTGMYYVSVENSKDRIPVHTLKLLIEKR